MKLSLKFLSMLSALLLVAACETPSDSNNTGAGAGANGANQMVDENGNPLTPEEAELRNSVGDRVFFAYDSSVLTSEGQATLQRQSAFASKYANLNFVIEGHCDERGTREYNVSLGQRRAVSVKKSFNLLGVQDKQIETVSFGEEKASANCADEACHQLNRRVDVVYEND